MYILITLQEESVHNNCPMGLKFWTNWRVDLKKIKIAIVGRFFEKWVQKYRILRTEFEGQFLGFHEKYLVDFFWENEQTENFLVFMKKIGGFLLEK